MQFWKEFFEASANVSLSGYQEAALEEHGVHGDSTTTLDTPTDHGEHAASGAEQQEDDEEDDFTIDSPTQVTGVQTTPKLPPSTAKKTATAAAMRAPSPRKYTGRNALAAADQPSTPQQARPTPQPAASSPFAPNSAFPPSSRRPNDDPLLHRGVLDKNYRIHATPHTQRREPKPTPSATATTKTALYPTSSPQSSPAGAAPQLRSDLFSPAKPRTPGLSVLKPSAAGTTTSTGRQLFSPQDKSYTQTKQRATTSNIFYDDSDDDDAFGGMSPPKTMQFHVPQSRLLQTPAREASKRIVEDLLLTAGAEDTDEIEADGFVGEEGGEEPSPSVVRRAFDVEDDTF